MTLAVPSYLALQLAATSVPRRDTATRRQRSSAGSPLTVSLILVPAGVACKRACPCTPVTRSAAVKADTTGVLPRLVSTPSAAAAAATGIAASQRRLFFASTGLTARRTGPPGLRRTAEPLAPRIFVSQSRTGSRSSYSDLQSAHVRRCRRTSALAPESSAPTMYAPMSPRHRAHAWLISVVRPFPSEV